VIDEADLGHRLADLVVAEVVARFPRVMVQQPEWAPGFSAIVDFTPTNPGGTPVVLYANYDWSFQLEAGGRTLFEDLEMDESEEERVARIVAEIAKIAAGAPPRTGWFGRLLDANLVRAEPWA
jgi:hypothetical protein